MYRTLKLLEKAGIDRARAMLCTLPSDAENVYAILNARELRPDLPIVALARDRRAESKLLRAGASRVQLYTGLIYRGPGLVVEIKRDLAELLRRDGFSSVAEAVGCDHR